MSNKKDRLSVSDNITKTTILNIFRKTEKGLTMEILAFIITIIAGILAEGIIGVRFNLPGIGSIVAIALIGAIILYTIRHKK